MAREIFLQWLWQSFSPVFENGIIWSVLISSFVVGQIAPRVVHHLTVNRERDQRTDVIRLSLNGILVELALLPIHDQTNLDILKRIKSNKHATKLQLLRMIYGTDGMKFIDSFALKHIDKINGVDLLRLSRYKRNTDIGIREYISEKEDGENLYDKEFIANLERRLKFEKNKSETILHAIEEFSRTGAPNHALQIDWDPPSEPN